MAYPIDIHVSAFLEKVVNKESREIPMVDLPDKIPLVCIVVGKSGTDLLLTCDCDVRAIPSVTHIIFFMLMGLTFF